MKRIIYAEDAMSRIKAETRFYSGTYANIERAIDAAPTIEPESLRPTAHWQGEYDGYANGNPVYDVWNCSACGYCIDDGTDDPDMLPKHCPECGARMIKDGERK